MGSLWVGVWEGGREGRGTALSSKKYSYVEEVKKCIQTEREKKNSLKQLPPLKPRRDCVSRQTENKALCFVTQR